MLIKQFSKYFSIGVLNTLIHWGVFLIMNYLFLIDQSVSNLSGFIVAVIFSFFMNAKYTFNQYASVSKFISYILFMGVFSYCIGFISDRLDINGIFTLIIFSACSLFFGFLYSKYIVFRG